MNIELMEVLYQRQQGVSKTAIGRSLGISRTTVRKYLKSAEELGLPEGQTLPPREELVKIIQPIMPETQDQVRGRPARKELERYHEIISVLTQMPHITIKQIWRLLKKDYEVAVGYNTVKSYVREHFEEFSGKPKTTVRLVIGPGEQGQVDYGYVGRMKDPVSGKELKTWAFIMVLAYSRHRYVEFVHEMDTLSWCSCHMRAFAFFGGVPQTIVLDNLKSGVIKADRYDPTLNRAYAELERHYGFVADPAKVRTPEHKGRVERQVPVVRQHFLAGRQFRDIAEANEKVLLWCQADIGLEVHGTTHVKPYEQFVEEEQSQLKALPEDRFEVPVWQKCKVNPDHHVVFQKSYYSVPTAYIGKEIWLRADQSLVRIFEQERLIKTHTRAQKAGKFVTEINDYDRSAREYLLQNPGYCLDEAAKIGEHVYAYFKQLLEEKGMVNNRKAQAVLRLAKKYPGWQLDRACERALLYGNFEYQAIVRILKKGILSPTTAELNLEPEAVRTSLSRGFVREGSYFFGPREEVANEVI